MCACIGYPHHSGYTRGAGGEGGVPTRLPPQHMHLRAKVVIDARKLERDVTAADDGHLPGQRIQVQHLHGVSLSARLCMLLFLPMYDYKYMHLGQDPTLSP